MERGYSGASAALACWGFLPSLMLALGCVRLAFALLFRALHVATLCEMITICLTLDTGKQRGRAFTGTGHSLALQQRRQVLFQVTRQRIDQLLGRTLPAPMH